ncbi:MAG: glycosyltransferase [Halioglobus sp.]|nr:glycosyltransferase [Halioglobus sp.]
MKVIHLNYSDVDGGAARAAYRIHHAVNDSGVDSVMWVNVAMAADATVKGPTSKHVKATGRVRSKVAGLSRKALRTENPILHSPAILSSNWVARVNASDADVVHLHWVQGEMLSIADIGRLEKPIVWTLHDMWAFCGAEHIAWDERWREGYRRDNRPAHESGFDLNRWTWERKREHWRKPMQIVTPSSWLAKCVQGSVLMKNWPISIIPNCLDTQIWEPYDRAEARTLLKLSESAPLLAFGSYGANGAPHKGFDLLLLALKDLSNKIPDLEVLVFGDIGKDAVCDFPVKVHQMGHLTDDHYLRAAYSVADAFLVPSRQDNLPNTAIEALACGVPVVAFDIGGMPDIVDHKVTGYIAEPFNTVDLADGIRQVLLADDKALMRKAARDSAIRKFSQGVITPQYIKLYQQACQLDSR